jgi:dihydrodipicolinate synthase/N-acetylneuraminate lyase
MWPVVSAVYAPPALHYYPRLKAAMWLAGMLPNTVVRAPLQSVSADELATLRNAVSAAGLGLAERNAPREVRAGSAISGA